MYIVEETHILKMC